MKLENFELVRATLLAGLDTMCYGRYVYARVYKNCVLEVEAKFLIQDVSDIDRLESSCTFLESEYNTAVDLSFK